MLQQQAQPILLGAAIAAVLVLCGPAPAQTQSTQLGAEWIPTDLNYRVISDLRKNSLQTPSEQIAGLPEDCPKIKASTIEDFGRVQKGDSVALWGAADVKSNTSIPHDLLCLSALGISQTRTAPSRDSRP